MPSLAEIRQQYPQYQDLSDEALADGLYQKFYSDIPREEFNRRLGIGGPPIGPGGRQVPQQGVEGPSTMVAGIPSQRAQAIRETISGPGLPAPRSSGGFQVPEAGVPGPSTESPSLWARNPQQEWLARQQEIERNLRSQGKSDAEIEADPEWQEASRNLSRSVSAGVSSTAIGEAGGGTVLPMAGRALAPVVRPIARQIGNAIGRGTTREIEALRGTGRELATGQVGQEEAAAAEAQRRAASSTAEAQAARARAEQIAQQQRGIAETAEQRAARLSGQQQQIGAGRGVAAQRAAARAPAVDPIHQRALAAARERVRQAEADYRAAGATAEEAKGLVMQRDAQIAQAEQEVAALEQRMLAQPQMDAATFGKQIRAIAQSIADRFGAIRAREADFPGAIRSAGDQPRVATGDILQMIASRQKNLGNPALRRTLDHIADELKTEGQPALNVEKAESLRKYLDSIISSRTILTEKGPLAVDKEALTAIKEIKKALVSNATAAWPPYRVALSKWSTLSRPLDIVERKGSLRKVIERDPVSTSYANSEADVVGQVIKKSGKGNPAFDRLVTENPEIRDSARLYFAKQLFGEGPVPSAAGFKSFLKANEGSLKQLGLYDEFRDLRVARQTAQRAVEDAKDARVLSAKDAKAAADAEAAEKKRVAVAETVRDLARKRAERETDATVTSRRVIESEQDKRAAAATKRLEQQQKDVKARAAEEIKGLTPAKVEARQAARTAETEAGRAQTAAEKAQESAKSLRLATEKLNAAPLDKVASVTRSLVESLKDTMTPAQYGKLLRQVQAAEDRLGRTEAARAQLRQISRAALYASIAGGSAYSTYRVVQSLVP